MIWLLKNRNQVKEEFPVLEGYVPVLDREYSEKELKKMCVYSSTPGESWSELSKLVMMIQGIEFSYKGYMYRDRNEVKKVIDIDFSFAFEMSFLYMRWDPKTQRYHQQIKDVFEHLSLVKVKEISFEEIQRRTNVVKNLFDHVVDSSVLNFFDNSYGVLLEKADINTKNLAMVLYVLEKSFDELLVYEADEEFLQKINEPREPQMVLSKIVR